MNVTAIAQNEELDLFKSDSKGNILFQGSGKYFRAQKSRFSEYTNPYQQLYKEQVKAVIKDSSEEIQSFFSL